MKKKLKYIIPLFVLLFVVINLVIFFVGRTSSEMVNYGMVEDAFHTTMYLFKDEMVIDASREGVLRPTASDGERVHKGARIGAILSEDTNESALHEYLRIQERIEHLESKAKTDGYAETVRTDEQITALSSQITVAAEYGEMETLTKLKDTLLIAKDDKTAAEGQKDALLGQLKSRQSALESGIGSSVKEIYSPEAGTLLLHTDGQEYTMNTHAAEGLTPRRLAEITENTGKSAGGCKILYNNEWKAACTVSENIAARLKVGQAVTLRLNDCGGVTEKAKIAEISAPEDGKCAVVFSCNRTPEGLMQSRKTSVDVVLARYEGLRVPKKALCEEGGQKGVYVRTITEQVFRPVDVAFENETYAIIREGEKTKLKLYDTVIY